MSGASSLWKNRETKMTETANDTPMRLGVSSCLLGEEVRYNGGHQLDRFVRDQLGQYVEYVPVCPEVECGLGIPREVMRLVGDPENPRLITSRTEQDMTERMTAYAERRVRELEKEDLCGFIFKSGSPSSGMERIKVYDKNGVPSKTGVGLFARAFMEHFPRLPVEDDGRLHDAMLRENFIERIFAHKRWKDLCRERKSRKRLVEFHTAHKLLILSHSPQHHREMGRLVARVKDRPLAEVYDEYEVLFLDALKKIATVKRQTNALNHVLGYFKKVLTADEKQEAVELIRQYHDGLVPLIVPITLLNHYVRKVGEPYLREQVYLHPHPVELKLRNHV